jgi:hypothetical protein
MMVLPSPSLGASSTQHNIYTAHAIAQKKIKQTNISSVQEGHLVEDQMSAKKT